MKADSPITDAARTGLSALLMEFNQRLQRLQQVLQEEQHCIARRLPEQLGVLLQEKLRLLQEIEQLDNQRITLLAAADLANDRAGMQALIACQGDAAAIYPLWLAILDSLSRCQAVNQASGTVIRKGMQDNRRLLDLLRGEDPDAASCYDVDGGTRGGTPGGGGRNLGTA